MPALKSRLQELIRETLIAVLDSRPGVSREEAEKMVARGRASSTQPRPPRPRCPT